MNELIKYESFTNKAQEKLNYTADPMFISFANNDVNNIIIPILIIFFMSRYSLNTRGKNAPANPSRLLVLLILVLLFYSGHNKNTHNNLSYIKTGNTVSSNDIYDDNPYEGGFESGYTESSSSSDTANTDVADSNLYEGSLENGYTDSSDNFDEANIDAADGSPYEGSLENDYTESSSNSDEVNTDAADSITYEGSLENDYTESSSNSDEVNTDAADSLPYESDFEGTVNKENNNPEVDYANGTASSLIEQFAELEDTEPEYNGNLQLQTEKQPIENQVTVEDNVTDTPLSLMIKDNYFGSNVTVLLSNASIVTGEVVFKFNDILSIKTKDNIIFINQQNVLSFL